MQQVADPSVEGACAIYWKRCRPVRPDRYAPHVKIMLHSDGAFRPFIPAALYRTAHEYGVYPLK